MLIFRNLMLFAIVFFITACSIGAVVNDDRNSIQEEQDQHMEEGAREAEFNAGEVIVEHITDAHEWHILSIGSKHVSIPLPVILHYKGRLYAFCFSKLHHGQNAYKGFKLETEEGENKGKIVKALPNSLETDPNAPAPLDLSITKNVLAIFISSFALCAIFISVANTYRKRKGKAPKGLQSLLEPVILFVRELAKSSIGEKKYEKYMPYLLTLFFFIFFNNLFGLIPFFPGGANVTGNLGVTMVMAVFTFFITAFSGNRSYWKHIFNTPGVPWWLKVPLPLMPIVEVMGIFTKPFVLMVRLFANISAGHIITLGFISLIFIFGQMNVILGYSVSVVSVFFAIFMGMLELLVAFIQAYVFTLLSALYFGMATEEHR